MKSTYKLLGVYWDGMKSAPHEKVQTETCKQDSSDYVSFKELLTVQDKEDLDRITLPFGSDTEITIGIDYHAEKANSVMNTFLEKRLSQMVAHLSDKYSKVNCVDL